MCSIIFQLGFLPFDEGSPACNGELALSAADWKSFGQSVGPPGASQSAKATPLAEIATGVTESFWNDQWFSSPSWGNIARDKRYILHTIKTGNHWPLMAIMHVSESVDVRIPLSPGRPLRPVLADLPRNIGELINHPKAMEAMMGTVKIDLPALQTAARAS